MPLLVFGINHRTAPVEIRERVAFNSEELPRALHEIRRCDGVNEALILSTCNRTEVYCAIDDLENRRPVEWLSHWHRLTFDDVRPFLYLHPEAHAVQHVLRVASGLDSMVLGEPQILGQLKAAYGIARTEGAIGKLLNKLFQYSFSVAKKVRSDTGVGASPVSIAFAAVRLAEQIFGDLSDQTALLIGAGDTIELAANHLHHNGLGRMIVANRSRDRALAISAKFGASAVALSDIPGHLPEADIVISATASRMPILGRPAVERALKLRKHRPMFLVDIAVPRDIEPDVGKLEDVYLYTVDDLTSVVQENLRSRQMAALQADEIITVQVREFMDWRQSLDAVDSIRALRDRAEAERERLVERARRQIARGEDPRAVVDALATALVNKLTHSPSVKLREAAAEGRDDVLTVLREIFGLP